MVKLRIEAQVEQEHESRYKLTWRVVNREKSYGLSRMYHPEELLIESLYDQIMEEVSKLIKDFIVKDQTGGAGG